MITIKKHKEITLLLFELQSKALLLNSILIVLFYTSNYKYIVIIKVVKKRVMMPLIELLLDVSKWSVSDVLSFISILIAIIGGIFAYKQWKYSNKIKRADFINQIIYKLRFDKSMVEIINMFDYNLAWYDENFHNSNNELEYKVDKTLSYLSYICYLIKEKHIRKSEFIILEYEIIRACISPEVKSYLWNLYHFSASQKATCSFQNLIEYGIKNKLIDETEFMNSKSKKYVKRLNF